ELVCSNSLKSDSENAAPWLLKEEMRRAGSLLMGIAHECAVPAGHALAVDRTTFAARVTEAISREPLITVRREEVTRIYENQATIIATGPLTSDALSQEIARLSGSSHLYFYDSISPIVEAESIDMSKVYLAARYDKGSADYINCPMSNEEYDRFYDALLSAQSVEERNWEKLNYFESCLPIEEIARRGRDTLRFGPMKPVGLKDPRTGLMAGIHASALASEAEPLPLPRATAFGSLVHYVSHADARNFQPANITFDLLPALPEKIRDRQQRHRRQCELALEEFDRWLERVASTAPTGEGIQSRNVLGGALLPVAR